MFLAMSSSSVCHVSVLPCIKLLSCLHIDRSGAYSFCPVCLSAIKFNIGHNFKMVCDGAFSFPMSIPCGKTFLWYQGQDDLSRSRSNTKFTFFKKCPLLGHSCFKNTSCLNISETAHIILTKFHRNDPAIVVFRIYQKNLITTLEIFENLVVLNHKAYVQLLLHVALCSGSLSSSTNYSPGVKFDATPGGHKFYMGLYRENFRNLPVPRHEA